MRTPTTNPNLTPATILSLGTDGYLRIAKGQPGAGQFVGAAGRTVLQFQATCREHQRHVALYGSTLHRGTRGKALQRRYEVTQPTTKPLDAASRSADRQAHTVELWYG